LQPPTRDAVRAAFDRLVRVLGPEDLLLVVLLGHGTWDGVDAKFNLVGPDLDAGEWRELLRPVRARVVLVNTTGASFPFLERLAGPKRIVITATASAAQRYDTVFPEYFIESLGDPAADLDKDGRVSLLEAFSAASRRVRQHYDERGQLATERALLDDTGDGIGKEAGAAGPDGAVAARTFFDAAVTPSAADPVLADLLQRRAALEAQVDELRARRPLMPAEDYAREFERLMIELARISREIRKRS
ncbi:MAG TPA: hypothetical protein VNI83_14760, partial [Vicinamibacterales bacterium]|nr:hypothetical protein [Vicinamibacterales bacterium]